MSEHRKNWFASAKTFAELHSMYAIATSPENLAADGERTPAESHARYIQISTDFEKRNLELGKSLMGIPNSPRLSIPILSWDNWHVSDKKDILIHKERPLLEEIEIMPALVDRKNTFAEVQTFGELYAMFKSATGPESFATDRELTTVELIAHYDQLRADFKARDVEIYDSLTNFSSRR